MMKKLKKFSNEKQDLLLKLNKKEERKIKFNLERSHLECFISSKTQPKLKDKKIEQPTSNEKISKGKLSIKLRQELVNAHKPKSHSQLDEGKIFNNSLLVMEYGQDQVYTDSTRSKNKPRSRTPSAKSEKSSETGDDHDFVSSCVRVITEDTDNTSNPVSARYGRVPLPPQYFSYSNGISESREPARYRQAVGVDETSLYQIELSSIEKDGRTTIMLRNIPNKYTRDMILQEIDAFNFKKKYDFFYLPIDYKNQCNVGYAFINFIHAKFIPEFYKLFHFKKWQKFNSQKICHLCYARIQGTAQLLNHFKDSNVLQQKDKKLRPLIDINYSHIASVVQRQKK